MKRPIGRPTIYHPEMATIANSAAFQGLRDEAIAARLRVGYRTYCRWKETIPEFNAALVSARRAYMLRNWDDQESVSVRNGKHEAEPRRNNALKGKDRILLYNYIKENAFLEPYPAGQSETWRYRDEMNDNAVALGYTDVYGVMCTKNNVRSVREEMWGKLAYDMDDAGKAIGAAGMWIYMKALEARIAHLEAELGITPK